MSAFHETSTYCNCAKINSARKYEFGQCSKINGAKIGGARKKMGLRYIIKISNNILKLYPLHKTFDKLHIVVMEAIHTTSTSTRWRVDFDYHILNRRGPSHILTIRPKELNRWSFRKFHVDITMFNRHRVGIAKIPIIVITTIFGIVKDPPDTGVIINEFSAGINWWFLRVPLKRVAVWNRGCRKSVVIATISVFMKNDTSNFWLCELE